jgi:hypothetical protein
MTEMADARRVVAAYPTYPEAEAAVEQLTRADFPVEHVSIAGRGLQMVEQVTGKTGWPDAVIRGMFAGALTGLLIGWLFGVFDWFNPIVASAWLAIDGFWFGALAGSLAGLIMWLIRRGRGDFESMSTLQAERYELLVDEQFADEAERLLAAKPAPQPTSDAAARA